jgi:hypothetical protein
VLFKRVALLWEAYCSGSSRSSTTAEAPEKENYSRNRKDHLYVTVSDSIQLLDPSTEPGEAAGWMVRTDAKTVVADGEAPGGEA